MKNAITLALFLCSLFFFSCTETLDPCEAIECGANGICNDGTCACDEGYEGTNCEIEARTKYYGTFTGTITCPGGNPQDYTFTFIEGNTINQLSVTFDTSSSSSTALLELDDNIATSTKAIEEFLGRIYEFTFTDENTVLIEFSIINDGMTTVCPGEAARE